MRHGQRGRRRLRGGQRGQEPRRTTCLRVLLRERPLRVRVCSLRVCAACRLAPCWYGKLAGGVQLRASYPHALACPAGVRLLLLLLLLLHAASGIGRAGTADQVK